MGPNGHIPVATDALGLWGPQAASASPSVHNSELADTALENLPWQVFIRRSLNAGEWPLWNPYIFAGFPTQGYDQNQLYYPVAWLLWLLPLPWAISMGVIFHVWLAGVGMYALARVVGASRIGSLLAGLAFSGSGMLYMGFEINGVAGIYGWLPLVVAAAEMAWRQRSWGWTAAAALLFGMLAVSGLLQFFVYATLFLSAWLLARLCLLIYRGHKSEEPGVRDGGSGPDLSDPKACELVEEAVTPYPTSGTGYRRELRGQALRVAALLAWGPALAAVHIVPFAQVVALSTRAGLSQTEAQPTGLASAISTLGHQLRLFVPLIYGTSAGSIGRPLVFNDCWYVGLATMFLAAMSLLLWKKRVLVRFLAAASVALFGVAANLPLFNILSGLPGVQSLVPSRAAYLLIFCMALLSALGLDAFILFTKQHTRQAGIASASLLATALPVGVLLLAEHGRSQKNPALYTLQSSALLTAGLVFGGLAAWVAGVLFRRGGVSPRSTLALKLLVACLTVADLLTYAPEYNSYAQPDALEPHSPSADFLHADKGLWRIMAPDAPNPMYPPNMALLYGLQDVQGYSSLHLARYEDYWAAADPKIRESGYFNVMMRPQNYFRPQADLLNTKYLTVWAPLNEVRQTSKRQTMMVQAGQTITQTFNSPEHLTGLRVAVVRDSTHAAINLHVRRQGKNRDLVSLTGDVANTGPDGWLDFNFAPLLDVHRDDKLKILLEVPAGRESVRVKYSTTDAYRYGELHIGGRKQPYDLGFVAIGTIPSKLEKSYDRQVAVYTNKAAMPRAFVVGSSEVLTAASIPGRIAERNFDPRKAVLLEETPPLAFAKLPTGEGPPGTAQITSYMNNSVSITTNMSRPGWLVLGDVNFPGWEAEVDGTTTPLYAAYYILRAVPMPVGTHQVRFVFRPMSVYIGGAISLLSLALALGTICRSLTRKQKSKIIA